MTFLRFHLSGLLNRVMREIFSHWRPELVYGQLYLVDVSPLFDKRGNICGVLFAFFRNGVYFIGKHTPKGSKLFPFTINALSEGSEKQF